MDAFYHTRGNLHLILDAYVAEEPHPFLNHDPLHLVKGDFLAPPVVELGGAG